MMRALILLHRWLGVAFCLLFAMWFASGIVMHFVPFPEPSEAERLAGLGPLALAPGIRGPDEAVNASGLTDIRRIKLMRRGDGSVYLISTATRTVALHAADLSDAAVHSFPLASAIAKDYAGHRRWDAAAASVAALKSYDQWTVAGDFDRDRPLYRIALHDTRGAELYVSSATGEVVMHTTRRQRAWNYVGSVAHWIYPTALRSHQVIWSRLVWALSLLALIGACAGAVIGVLRLMTSAAFASPYRGWQRWHHWLGLCCALFLLAWIFSGWLSMDNGMLFSTGAPAGAEVAAIAGTPDWKQLPRNELQQIGPQIVEAEWFAFGGRIYRRDRDASGLQRLTLAGAHAVSSGRAFLDAADVNMAAAGLARRCRPAVVDGSDGGPLAAGVSVYRLVCGDDWFLIDGASGILLEKLDPSRRAYRRLFGALHRLDFPILMIHPAMRTALIVGLCGSGFIFSLTAVIIAWRRLRFCLKPAARQN